uniref:Uncharacterized protein n=1 Tax=Palpitomonas bilix TaxID=652834 RepID=A0A7S3G740_9EUKA|mmetsp:Transcript_24926/g.62806  ORF Transcript_24926/g.62806 Transcript_24926/m.62806 type:complete len:566 (+) Transcript_24926:124-1821(+)
MEVAKAFQSFYTSPAASTLQKYDLSKEEDHPLFVHFQPMKDKLAAGVPWIIHSPQGCFQANHVFFESVSFMATAEVRPADAYCSCGISNHHLAVHGRVRFESSKDVNHTIVGTEVNENTELPIATIYSVEEGKAVVNEKLLQFTIKSQAEELEGVKKAMTKARSSASSERYEVDKMKEKNKKLEQSVSELQQQLDEKKAEVAKLTKRDADARQEATKVLSRIKEVREELAAVKKTQADERMEWKREDEQKRTVIKKLELQLAGATERWGVAAAELEMYRKKPKTFAATQTTPRRHTSSSSSSTPRRPGADEYSMASARLSSTAPAPVRTLASSGGGGPHVDGKRAKTGPDHGYGGGRMEGGERSRHATAATTAGAEFGRGIYSATVHASAATTSNADAAAQYITSATIKAKAEERRGADELLPVLPREEGGKHSQAQPARSQTAATTTGFGQSVPSTALAQRQHRHSPPPAHPPNYRQEAPRTASPLFSRSGGLAAAAGGGIASQFAISGTRVDRYLPTAGGFKGAGLPRMGLSGSTAGWSKRGAGSRGVSRDDRVRARFQGGSH